MNSQKRQRKFISTKGVSKFLYCTLCGEIFEDPVLLFNSCGHTFCRSCISKWAKESDKCPKCCSKFDINLVEKDFIGFNIINELDVYCSNSNCPWRNKLCNLDEHLKICNFDPSKMDNTLKEILDEKNKEMKSKCIIDPSYSSKINKETEKKKDNDQNISNVDSNDTTNNETPEYIPLLARLYNKNKNLVTAYVKNEKNNVSDTDNADKDIIKSIIDI